eukprot:CAMPEP_0176488674 /NCGR_PEP_ID=MMETSP0200_2-20121128/6844_1 /TAXON_ID=947934 /ORGANISM="Chaetoceros sp., Strain GSL56" /LENGTH=491 /DNA_ID=CAMNT_0017885691 /DNA_START=291 /DNA_END=1763 /DNA_ORIENTATION=-
MERPTSSRLRDVLKSSKFQRYKGFTSSTKDVEIGSRNDAPAAGKMNGYESGDRSTLTPEIQRIPQKGQGKRNDSDRMKSTYQDTKKVHQECRDDIHMIRKESMYSEVRSTPENSLIKARGDPENLKSKFLKAAQKRSTSRQSERRHDTASSRPNSQQRRNQTPPVLTSYISKPKEAEIVKKDEPIVDSSMSLRQLLQSNKSISPETIERIMAIENEARQQLDHNQYTSFQTELSKQTSQKDNFHSYGSFPPNSNLIENEGLGRNTMVSFFSISNQREKAKEIIAKRQLGKYSSTVSEQRKILSQALSTTHPSLNPFIYNMQRNQAQLLEQHKMLSQVLPTQPTMDPFILAARNQAQLMEQHNMMSQVLPTQRPQNQYMHAPTNQSQSYRSIVPNWNVPLIDQPRMVVNGSLPGALGQPIMNQNNTSRINISGASINTRPHYIGDPPVENQTMLRTSSTNVGNRKLSPEPTPAARDTSPQRTRLSAPGPTPV